jgi:hypothetical protein
VFGRLFDGVRRLVPERVTYSVRHAPLTRDATVRVGVAIVGGVARVAVEELGDGAIGAVFPNREHGGGFGLYLVEIFAERWDSTNDGTTRMWAELAVSAATWAADDRAAGGRPDRALGCDAATVERFVP